MNIYINNLRLERLEISGGFEVGKNEKQLLYRKQT